MKLTLYKKCILNNSYTEVFNVKAQTVKNGQSMSILDAYLTTLDKFEYENEFIYTEQTGSFQIELYPLQNADDIYSFNYLKVEEKDETDKTVFKRYCFIDDIIKIASDVVTVYYSEDIWSSYSETMEIRDGVITNKRLNPSVPYYLPVPYDGNNYPTFYSFDNRVNPNKFVVIAQLQLYKLVEDGRLTKRTTLTCVLGQHTKEHKANNEPLYFNDLSIINSILSEQSSTVTFQRYNNDDTSNFDFDYSSFQIDNLIALPVYESTTFYAAKFNEVGWWTTSISSSDLNNYPSALKINTGNLVLYQGNVGGPNLFDIIGIGTTLHQYEAISNGSPMQVKIELAVNDFDAKVILYVQNKKIDITKDFIIKAPFDTLTSEQNIQKQIQREVATLNGIFNIVEGTAQTAIQIGGAIMTGGISLTGGSVTNQTVSEKYNYSRIDRQLTSASYSKTSERRNKASAGGIVGGTIKIANGITDIVYANKPKYTNTTGTFAVSDGFLNAYNGFGILRMNEDNKEYVDELIKRQGYTVFMTVKSYNELISSTLDNYDIIKMATVTLYGNFPQSINYELTQILRNGIRIFLTDNVNI